jgi:hypothetical protein
MHPVSILSMECRISSDLMSTVAQLNVDFRALKKPGSVSYRFVSLLTTKGNLLAKLGTKFLALRFSTKPK